MAKKKTQKQHNAEVAAELVRQYNAAATKKAANADPVVTTSPTVQPFLTGDDLTGLAGVMQEVDQKLGFTDEQGVYHPGSLDTGLDAMKGQTTADKANTDKSAKQNTADTTDSAIARGLFQSSIKDASIYDIEAQRAIQQKFLDDRLATATVNANTEKSALNTWKTKYNVGLAAKAAENAAAVPVTATTTQPTAQTFTPRAPAATAKPGKPGVAQAMTAYYNQQTAANNKTATGLTDYYNKKQPAGSKPYTPNTTSL